MAEHTSISRDKPELDVTTGDTGSRSTSGAELSERPSERRVLEEEDAPEALAFAFPTWKKWAIITVVFVIQVCSALQLR